MSEPGAVLDLRARLRAELRAEVRSLGETVGEIVAHAPLVRSLVAKELSVRYRGSILGFVWTFLNPLFLMLVYALVFSIFVRDPRIEHYATYVFCGLLPWIWFSTALLEGANSIVGGGSLITKALFPPQILPTVVVLTNTVNFVLSLLMLIPFLIGNHLPFWGPYLLALPVVAAVELYLIFAAVLFVSALNVHYRDVQHILANILTLWFFLCPIIFHPETVRDKGDLLWLLICKINPMGVVSSAYHDVFYWGRWPDFRELAYVVVVASALLLVGNGTFRRYRDTFAEEI